jgi:hypothetical protein
MIKKFIIVISLLLSSTAFAVHPSSTLTKIWPFDESRPIPLNMHATFSSYHGSITSNSSAVEKDARACFILTACREHGPKATKQTIVCRDFKSPSQSEIRQDANISLDYVATYPMRCTIVAETVLSGSEPAYSADVKNVLFSNNKGNDV